MKKIGGLLALVLLLTLSAGCAGGRGETVSVQSVAMICGVGSAMQADRFAGVIEAKGETKIRRDADKTVAEIRVRAGDKVSKDQVLFIYDKEQLEIDLEKAQLELEQLKNALASAQSQIAQLEKDRAAASADEKLAYSLEIQETNAEVTETKYNISVKEKEIERLKNAVSGLEVKSPVTGQVQSVNENAGADEYGYGDTEQPFIVISETGAYRVKGYVNELNRSVIAEGLAVLIRSRVDDAVLRGTVTKVDLDAPQKSGGEGGYYATESDDDTQTSNKYPFYVDIEKTGDFILGQHVFIEPDYGQQEETDGLRLPSCFVADADSAAYVWAQNAAGRLEKRTVELGEYDEQTDSYTVTDGISPEDYIAFPDESLHEGMNCSPYDDSDEGAFYGEDGAYQQIDGGEALEDGVMFDGASVEKDGGGADAGNGIVFNDAAENLVGGDAED